MNALTPTAPTTLTDRLIVATATGLHLPGRDSEVLTGRRVDALAVDADRLWVLVDRQHLHRIGPEGIALVTSLGTASATCLGVHNGTVWAGGDDARLWRLDGDTFESVSAFDDAPTSERWSTPWGGPPAVFSITGHDEDVFVSVHVGGILRSADLGRSWAATIDLDTDVHQVALGSDGTMWAATGTSGLGESRDRGVTWQFHTKGLHATYLLAVAVTDDGPVVAAASGHAGTDGALYRFDGRDFHCDSPGLPDRLGGAVQPRHIAASGPNAVVALPNGSVVASADSGRTWATVTTGLPDVTEVAIAAHTLGDFVAK